MSTRHQESSGLKLLIQHVTSSTEYTSRSFWKKYELLTGKKPNVSYFRVFGARCWIKDPHHKSKFAPKAHEGFMLGYGKDSHSYRVFNLYLYKIVETVDVKFDEIRQSS